MSASNAQKTPFARSFNEAAAKRVANAIQLLGKALPAEVVKVDPTVGGAIVTVKFPITSPFTLPQVRMPAAMSEYTRLPLQAATDDTPGTKGVCFPADTFIGLTSGLAAGAAPTLVQPGNLAALVFFPIGNANWTAPDDPNALVLYGEPDVIIKEKGGACSITVRHDKIIISGPVEFEDDVTMDNDLTVTNDLTVDQNFSYGGGAKKIALDNDPIVGGHVVASSTKGKGT